MNAGPAGSAASRSRARLGLGAAAAEREVYKAAPGNGCVTPGPLPPPRRPAAPVGARHCPAAGAREGAAGSGARRGSSRGTLSGCPGRPASPAIATDAGDSSPPPSRPSGTRRSAAAARPLLEDAVARPGSRLRCPGPQLLGNRSFLPLHDPNPRILLAVPSPQLPGNSLPPGACPPTQVLPTPLGPQLLRSRTLPAVHTHPDPSPPPYVWPAHRTCRRRSLRLSVKVAGVGVLPHCVCE